MTPHMSGRRGSPSVLGELIRTIGDRIASDRGMRECYVVCSSCCCVGAARHDGNKTDEVVTGKGEGESRLKGRKE